MEKMPMWCPPTPPQDNDEREEFYIDYSLSYMYSRAAIPVEELPPIYVRKEFKRSRNDAGFGYDGSRRPNKMRREDTIFAPRSIFDRPSAVLSRIRRDLKQQRFRGVFKPNVQIPGLRQALPLRPLTESECVIPEWSIFEDIAILHVLVNLQGLPCNLMILSPGHTPNWDLVAEVVNHYSKSYRSPKQCRWRYETVIQPREEGKLVESPKKQKKLKSNNNNGGNNINNNYKCCEYMKGPLRCLVTTQLFVNDGNASFIKMMMERFDTIKTAYLKKAPPPKRQCQPPNVMNPKHVEVLRGLGVMNYDLPISPINVAIARANKMRDKQRGQQQQHHQQQQQQQQITTPGTSNNSTIQQSQSVVQQQLQQQQQQLQVGQPQQQSAQQQIHELITNFNQQAQSTVQQQQHQHLQIQQHIAAQQHQQQTQSASSIILQQQQQNQLLRVAQAAAAAAAASSSSSSSNSAGNNNQVVPTQIVRPVNASQQQQQIITSAHGAGTTVLTSNVQTLAAVTQQQQQVTTTCGTQIMSIATQQNQQQQQQQQQQQPTSVSSIVQTMPSQSMPHVVSVSQLATVGTVLTSTAGNLPINSATAALRGQRIVSGNDVALLQQRAAAAGGQTIVSMSNIGQNVGSPAQFQTTQLRLTTIGGAGSGGTQQLLTKSIPVSSLQQGISKSGATATNVNIGGQQTQIHLYRHRQQLKVLQSGMTLSTTAGGNNQVTTTQLPVGTQVVGNLITAAQSSAGGNQMQLQTQKATGSGTVAGAVATVQLAHNQQQRTQFIKQMAQGQNAVQKQTLTTRQLNESDMLLVKRQVISGHQKAQLLQQAQVFTTGNVANSGGNIQLQQQQQQQQQQQPQSSNVQQINTVVKNAQNIQIVSGGSAANVTNSPQLSTLSQQVKQNQIKVTMANQVQMRHLQMQQTRKVNRMTQITAAAAASGGQPQQQQQQIQQMGAQGGVSSTVLTPGLQINSQAVAAGTQTKVTQNSSGGNNNTGNVQAQLLHIQNTKSLPNSVTVQQIQQVMRQNHAGGISSANLVFGKTSVGRVIPVSVSSQAANQRQTFQVVSSALANSGLRAHNVTGTQNIKVSSSNMITSVGTHNNSGSAPQQALITAIQQQAAVQQNQRQNASPARLQNMGSGNLVAVVHSQQQQQNITSSAVTVSGASNEMLNITTQNTSGVVTGTTASNFNQQQQQSQSSNATSSSGGSTIASTITTTQQL